MITGLAVSFVAGLLLAAANYAALWFTVKKLVSARNPAVLALASFVLRTALVILGFYMLSDGEPIQLAACIIGFVLVRTIAVRRITPVQAAKGSAV